MQSMTRKKPRCGVPPSKPFRSGFDPDETAPSWYELVQPPAKADPVRTFARREERGQVVPDTTIRREDEQSTSAVNRETRRAAHGRGWNPGRVVLHRTRFRAVDSGARPDVERRRAERARRAAA